MAVKIFLTGATGYIGGSILDHLFRAHPDYEYTVLVRDEKRGEPVKAKYPKVKLAIGNLDDAEVLEKQAAEADVVIHTADSSDNPPAAHAIAKGIKAGHTAEKPGYWIHLCGTSILTWYDAQNGREGEAPIPEQKYHDIDDIKRLVTLPDDAHHRDVDKIVQDSISDSLKLAIVCPPTIYGVGSGPVKTLSQQVPGLVRATLKAGYAPIVGKGLTEWDNVHIDDVSDVFVRLVDASQNPSKKDNPEIFGLNGYFFAAGGSHLWSDVSKWVAEEAHKQGLLPEATTKQNLSMKEIQDATGEGSVPSWGRNSKGVPARASKYLGWQPRGSSLKDDIPVVVREQAKAMGKTPK